MRVIKLAIISIVVLFLILTALGLLLPSTVRVTRNINIHAPFDTLHYYTGNIKNWPFWMEGIKASEIKVLSSQTVGKATAVTIGRLQVHLLKDTKDTIESVWQSNNRAYRLCIFQLYSDTATDITNLNWYFEQKLHWYPWERLPAIANDKVLGPFMEHSLDKLKELTERK